MQLELIYRPQEIIRDAPWGCKVVYAVEIEGRIKIGISSQLRKRLQKLEAAVGKRMRVAWVSPICRNAPAIEKKLHALFADHRQVGEWFNVCLRDVAEAMRAQEYDVLTLADHHALLTEAMRKIATPGLTG